MCLCVRGISGWSCICVLGVSVGGHVFVCEGYPFIFPLSTICRLDFGTVPTVWYFRTVPTVWYFRTVPTVWYFRTVPIVWYFRTVPTV